MNTEPTGPGDAPNVTVLMAAHNAERHVARSIESILSQTFRDFELLVVDDGSTDATAAVVRRFTDARLKLLSSTRNLGLPGALNVGLQAARGAYVARQDHDDISHPTRLEKQVRFLDAHGDVALLGTRAWLIDDGERRIGTVDRCLEDVSIRWFSLLDNPFIHSSVMFRRGVIWDELGGYDPSLRSSEDYHLWSRVLERFEGANLPDRLISYRLVPSSKMAMDEEALAADAGQAVFPRTLRKLVTANIRRMFGDGAVSDEDAAVMSGFVLGLPAASVERFLGVFGHLLALYEDRRRDCWTSADFRRTVAVQLDAVACRAFPAARRLALQAYAWGIRRHPSLAWSLDWPKVVATLVLGGHVRARVARARRHSAAPTTLRSGHTPPS